LFVVFITSKTCLFTFHCTFFPSLPLFLSLHPSVIKSLSFTFFFPSCPFLHSFIEHLSPCLILLWSSKSCNTFSLKLSLLVYNMNCARAHTNTNSHTWLWTC
jgi:hypothetical protein